MKLFIPNSQLLYTPMRADACIPRGTHLQYVYAAWSRTLWARTFSRKMKNLKYFDMKKWDVADLNRVTSF